jgi:hypothetical protein
MEDSKAKMMFALRQSPEEAGTVCTTIYAVRSLLFFFCDNAGVT